MANFKKPKATSTKPKKPKPKKEKPINPFKKEYDRVRANLLAKVRRLEKQGFYNVRTKVPNIPKKIDQGSINKLTRLSSDHYSKLKEGLVSATGLTTKDVEHINRKRGAEKRSFTQQQKRKTIIDWIDNEDTLSETEYADLVIGNYLKELDVNDTFASYLSDFIEGLRDIYNDSAVANMIQRFADTGTLPSRWQMYTAEGAYNFTSSIFAHMYPDLGTQLADSASIEATDALAKSTYHNYTGMFDTMRSDYNNARRSARLAENKNG